MLSNLRMWAGDKLYRLGEALEELAMDLTGAREATQRTPEE